MKGASIADWQRLAQSDPEGWSARLRGLVAECIDRTNTSVVSADLSRDQKPTEGPLGGVPCGLKDLFDLAGAATHASSVLPPLLERRAAADSELAARLRALGAACAVKTQMNEFAYGLSGENPHYGNCPHPRLAACLSGGSSSGSAHLVAAGCLPLAFGTDTGGSIRLPAAWCGLYGIRWAPGYFMKGALPLAESFDTMGWFTNTAEDMAAVLRAWFGGEAGARRPAALRIVGFLPEGSVGGECANAMERAFGALGLGSDRRLEGLSDLLPECNQAFNVLQSREAFRIHEDWLDEFGPLYDPAVRARIERGREWPESRIEDASRHRAAVSEWFGRFFESHDVLAMPIAPGPSIPPAEATPDLREKTLRLTTPASLASRPALAVPIGLDEGRSVGIQFIFKEVGPSVPLALLERCANI